MKKPFINSSLKSLILLLLLVVGTTNLTAQTHSEKIAQLMRTYEDFKQFNGSVLVAENGEVIYKDGLGMANFEWDIPNTADTKHRLGSITKQFTAALILLLVEEGKIELDKPVTAYLPEYPANTGAKITIHHLLTHTSGVPNYTAFPNFFKDLSRNPYTPKESTELFKDKELDFEPGEKFSYSNSGYNLLGYIIEEVTGKSYEDALEEMIFTPLNMKDSGYDHHEMILKKRATGYQKSGSLYRNSPYIDMSIPYAAGSLYSTAEDLYKWDRALKSNKLLTNASKKLMFGEYASAWGGSYGYGWHVNYIPIENSKDSLKVISHGGGINGFNTNIFRIPEDDNLIVLLNNTGGANLNAITLSIKNILYNEPYSSPKQSVALALLERINKDGLEAGLSHFENLIKMDSYKLSEGEMNSLGYQFLAENKTEEAIAIFKLNVKQFPESSNTYDSLGEAYLKTGNKDLALENYKIAHKLNPKNLNAKKIVEDLSL